MATALRAQAFPGEDRAPLPDPAERTAQIVRLAEKDSADHGALIRLYPAAEPGLDALAVAAPIQTA